MKKPAVLLLAVILAGMAVVSCSNPVYYSVQFDSDGGSRVDPQTVEAGKNAEEPDDPEKAGLIFMGWFTEAGTEWDFATPVTENMTLYAQWLQLLPVGGTIFYNDISKGGAYKFYNAGNAELTNIDISITSRYDSSTNPNSVVGNPNVKYYSVTAAASGGDRFYVFDSTTNKTITIDGGSVRVENGLARSLQWGYYTKNTGVTANTIGSGKTNTRAILAMGVPTDYQPNIWAYVKYLRNNSINGCTDWFIPSKAELDALKTYAGYVSKKVPGTPNWFGTKFIWSSVEYDSYEACFWYYMYSCWDNSDKNNTYDVVAVRSF